MSIRKFTIRPQICTSGQTRTSAGLVAFVKDGSLEVNPGVKWCFIPTESQIDFRENQLSLTIANDQLTASVIEYEPPEDTAVLVATADIRLEIKLHHPGIAPLLLPQDAKLPDEPDAQDKECRRTPLSQQNRRYPERVQTASERLRRQTRILTISHKSRSIRRSRGACQRGFRGRCATIFGRALAAMLSES
ncbi:hypothetical protein [Steroidobacter sp.]|uniref:hypothetical protein n=1 Tax=Steroidobacter sp. TaxID=1978227 RepID=UPI001A602B9F|nr:hypothetical protein [Steroidobacter sp.]MBL8266012.1 hypothetical protein [Steroidobacter sp.]